MTATREPIFIVFSMSVETVMLPDDCKIAQISPIFKKGHRCKADNYRPASLTTIICKIPEKLVRRNIIDHLELNELIEPAQQDSSKCVTNHLETFEQWTHILDDGGSIDVIYMDFMKAFDKVPHMRLLVKLQSYDIILLCSKTLDWIKAFLAGRHQCVHCQRTDV